MFGSDEIQEATDLTPMPLTALEVAGLRSGHYAALGAATLGSAVGQDWLGAGASLSTIVGSLRAGTDLNAWHKTLKNLANRGWHLAEEARRQEGNRTPEPDRKACVEYVMDCVVAGRIPTVNALLNVPKVGLNDPYEPGCRQAGERFLSSIIRTMLTDRTFLVMYALAATIRGSDEARSTLERESRQHRAVLGELDSRIENLWVSLELLSSPGLRPQERETRGDGLLDFWSDAVEFYGREEELRELIRFCGGGINQNGGGTDSDEWRWQAITGPGGSGKSRLARELCLRMQRRGWEAFFLHRSALETPPPASLKNSPADMLLVLDYVAFATERVAKWLAQLPTEPTRRIRVVMVERDSWPGGDVTERPPAWHQEIGRAWSALDLEQHRAKLESPHPVVTLAEKPLSEGDLMNILRSVGSNEAPVDEDGETQTPCAEGGPGSAVVRVIPEEVAEALIERLKTSIDPDTQRPLFLLFLARTYLVDPSDEGWRSWSINDLHGIIYQRELQQIEHKVSPDWAGTVLDLWAFSTATGTPIHDVTRDVPDWLVTMFEGQTNLKIQGLRRKIRACCGGSTDDVLPFRPDIPGEYLVIARLSDWEEEERYTFTQSVWEHSPEQYAAFLSRALADLDPTAPKIAAVMTPTGLLTPPPNQAQVLQLARSLATALDPLHPRTDVRDQLVALADTRRDEEELTTLAVRAIMCCGTKTVDNDASETNPANLEQRLQSALPSRDITQNEELSSKMESVLEEWEGTLLALRLSDAKLDEFQALIDLAEDETQPEHVRAEANASMLLWMEEHRPDYKVVVQQCTAGVLTAFVNSTRQLAWIPVESILQKVSAEGPKWSPICVDPETLPLLRAESLLQRTSDDNLAPGQVHRLLEELRVLTGQHPDNPDIALRLARGLVSLTNKSGVEVTEVREVVEELRTVTAQHPNNPDIALQLTRGLVSLTATAGVEVTEAREVVEELRTVTGQHPNNPDIALRLARGLVILTNKSGVEMAEVREVVEELRTVTAQHPNNPDIALGLSRGLFNLTNKSGVEVAEVREVVEDLRTVTGQHPNDPDIALGLSMGLFNLTNKSGVEVTETREVVEDLRTVAAQHPNNPDIALMLVTGMVRLSSRPETRREEVQALMSEADGVLQDLPDGTSQRSWIDRFGIREDFEQEAVAGVLDIAISTLGEPAPAIRFLAELSKPQTSSSW